MPENHQGNQIRINITAQTHNLARLTATKLIDHLYLNFPQEHQKFSHFSLSCDHFKSNSHNPKTWTVSFESHDVVIGKTDLPYLSEGLLTAIDVNDVRDYIIDFICTHEIGSNIQISFSLSSKIVHFEKLIAHNLS